MAGNHAARRGTRARARRHGRPGLPAEPVAGHRLEAGRGAATAVREHTSDVLIDLDGPAPERGRPPRRSMGTTMLAVLLVVGAAGGYAYLHPGRPTAKAPVDRADPGPSTSDAGPLVPLVEDLMNADEQAYGPHSLAGASASATPAQHNVAATPLAAGTYVLTVYCGGAGSIDTTLTIGPARVSRTVACGPVAVKEDLALHTAGGRADTVLEPHGPVVAGYLLRHG